MLTNVANAVHSVYVFNLPAGPFCSLTWPVARRRADARIVRLRYRDGGQGSAGGQGTDSQPDKRPDKRPNGRPDGGPRKVQPSVSQ